MPGTYSSLSNFNLNDTPKLDQQNLNPLNQFNQHMPYFPLTNFNPSYPGSVGYGQIPGGFESHMNAESLGQPSMRKQSFEDHYGHQEDIYTHVNPNNERSNSIPEGKIELFNDGKEVSSAAEQLYSESNVYYNEKHMKEEFGQHKKHKQKKMSKDKRLKEQMMSEEAQYYQGGKYPKNSSGQGM